MKISLLVLALGFSASAFALNSGDRIRCYDNVSRETFKIKIVDVGDEEASVRVSGANARVYPASRVIFEENSAGAVIAMSDKSGRVIETLEIPQAVELGGKVLGTYLDGGDSRGVDCVLLK